MLHARPPKELSLDPRKKAALSQEVQLAIDYFFTPKLMSWFTPQLLRRMARSQVSPCFLGRSSWIMRANLRRVGSLVTLGCRWLSDSCKVLGDPGTSHSWSVEWREAPRSDLRARATLRKRSGPIPPVPWLLPVARRSLTLRTFSEPRDRSLKRRVAPFCWPHHQ